MAKPMLDWRRAADISSLLDMFHQGVALHPDRAFTIFQGKTLTWGEAARAVAGVAADLEAGTDIALIVPNSPIFLIAFLGALQAGARPALINAALPVPLTQKILDEIAPAQILTAGQIDLDRGEIAIKTLPSNDPKPAPKIEPDAIAAYFLTGGTTGVPKRIAYTHEMMVAGTERMHWGWPMRDAEVHLSIAPFTHIYGFYMGVGMALKVGATNVLPGAFTPDGALALMEAHGVTVLGGGPPAIYQALLSSPSLADRDLSALRVCPGGGAPFPIETHNRWKAATGLTIFEGYGMTEIAPISVNTAEAGARPGAAGKPPPDTYVEVVDVKTGANVLAPGEVGEIRTKGPHQMAGYLANDAETAIAMRDGWVMTGDIGKLDEDGFLIITDRKKDVIITNGYNVFPREVEEVLAAVPGVATACAVGIPDHRRGEAVIAFVAGTADVAALEAACWDGLAAYKVPTAVHVLQTLPLTPAGKVDRMALRELAQP
jgi:long-chain acyl-CoA synthetase